jgi:dUTP pyrophosphatase
MTGSSYVPNLKIKLDGATMPSYAHEGDSGFDLCAKLGALKTLHPGTPELISTGIYLGIPSGTEIQVRSRSSMAKEGLVVANSPGTVDAGYTGEIKVLLVNIGRRAMVITPGQRIAQAVLSPVLRAKFEEVSDLDETARGDGGFGSTGK